MTQTILLTGASGFLGSHIAVQLLNKGYRVRAIVREPKVAELRKSYEKFGDKFELVPISDISTDEFPEAFKGVDAVIHSAAALAYKQPEEVLKSAVEGTLNILRQAEKAGIKRLVVTSTIVTATDPAAPHTEQNWYPTTKEQALTGSAVEVYFAAKTLAEQELWAFGESHPDVDITTVNPPLLYGPFAETLTPPVGNYFAMSTDFLIYQLLQPAGAFPPSASYVDVRDAAKAHVLALTSPPPSSVGRKRMFIASPHGFNAEAHRGQFPAHVVAT